MINRRTSTRTDAIESDMNAAELGAMLREARLAQGRELRDVANELRIRPAYLQAIEEGRLRDLPGSAYALGFLRTYAESLGLNADEVINRYRLTDSSLNRQTALVMPAPTEEGRLPSGSILLVAAILALGAYGGWYYLSSRGQDPVEVVSAVPRQLAALVGLGERDGAAPAVGEPASGRSVSTRIESGGHAQDGFGSREEDAGQTPRGAEPAATVAAPASVAPATPPAAVPSAAAPPVPAPQAAPTAAPPPPAAASRPAASAEHPPLPAATPLLRSETLGRDNGQAAMRPPAAGPGGPEFGAVASAAAALRPAEPSGRVVLRARADSWVELRSREGAVILSRVIAAGDSYRVPGDGITMTTGNAGGLEILVDGQAVPPLGGAGTVVRGVTLDAERLLAAR